MSTIEIEVFMSEKSHKNGYMVSGPGFEPRSCYETDSQIEKGSILLRGLPSLEGLRKSDHRRRSFGVLIFGVVRRSAVFVEKVHVYIETAVFLGVFKKFGFF